MLKAALNFAYREGRVASNEAWRRVRLFRGVDAPRVRYLTQEESARLLNGCDADFRPLVKAALLTGCRYGELTGLRGADFLPEAPAVHVAKSKSSKARNVYLTDGGAAFFAALAAGSAPNALLFTKKVAEPWAPSQQKRRMESACKIARIDPPISFHILRHTYASLYLMAGGSLPALAHQLGHADARMATLHYGHLAEDWRAEEARKYGPRFPGDEPPNVVDLTHRVLPPRRGEANSDV